MEVLDKKSVLWSYMSENQKGLIQDGEALLSHVEHLDDEFPISDYSFMVFPFAKAYEGFLKQFFLDLGMIKEDGYYSDEIRIGRILNPNYLEKQTSVYNMLCEHKRGGKDLSDRLWDIWRKGRNQVFHYFPHNFRKLTYREAIELIEEFISVMSQVVTQCELAPSE